MTDPLIRNIQQRITDAGYPTLQAFAEKSGIRLETVNKWIEGKSRPSKKSLEKLAALLECSVEDFTRNDTGAAADADAADADKDRQIERLQKVVRLQQRLIDKLENMLALR